jgi:hypothetical protein
MPCRAAAQTESTDNGVKSGRIEMPTAHLLDIPSSGGSSAIYPLAYQS